MEQENETQGDTTKSGDGSSGFFRKIFTNKLRVWPR